MKKSRNAHIRAKTRAEKLGSLLKHTKKTDINLINDNNAFFLLR